MSIWEHLFLTGEFRAREDLLSGLTIEQVTLRPAGSGRPRSRPTPRCYRGTAGQTPCSPRRSEPSARATAGCAGSRRSGAISVGRTLELAWKLRDKGAVDPRPSTYGGTAHPSILYYAEPAHTRLAPKLAEQSGRGC